MRRWLIVLATVGLLALSFAALDDITTGNEPNFYAEYVVVTITVLWCAVLIAARLRRPT